jgi:hypothetical protein
MRVHGGTALLCTHRTSEAIKSLYRAGLVLSLCLSCSLRKLALPLAGSIVRAASNTGGDWA